MSLGGLVGEPIEVAAENVCRRPGPIDGQQLRRQLRIVERDPAKGVDQERPHDETLFGIVVGVSPEESRYILTKLRDWATQPQFVYRHHWKLGDTVIWDNTGTMHRATPYPVDSGRKMTRTFKLLVLIGIAINLFGAITFGRAGQFYYDGYFPPGID